MIKNPNLSGLVAIALWASSALIVSYTGNVPPMLLTSVAAFLGFVVCLVYWLVKKKVVLQQFRLSARAYALGVFGICGYLSLWLMGLKLAPAFAANALNYLWPLFLFILSARLDGTSVPKLQAFGILLGIVGSLLIFSRYGARGDFSVEDIVGLLCALAGAVVWAVYSAFARKVVYASDSVGVFLLITAAVTFFLHMLFEQAVEMPLSILNIFAIFLLGISRTSFVFWDQAMKDGDRQLLSSLSLLVPALSVGLLALFTSVQWNLPVAAGAVLVVSGCLVGNSRKLVDFFQSLSWIHYRKKL